MKDDLRPHESYSWSWDGHSVTSLPLRHTLFTSYTLYQAGLLICTFSDKYFLRYECSV